MNKVHNKYYGTTGNDAVYIGRGSPFGNPFAIGKNGDRNEVCEKFKEMIDQDDRLLSLVKTELKGKDLVCFCKPARCHGDYLLEIANET